MCFIYFIGIPKYEKVLNQTFAERYEILVDFL